ncbi:anti-sigma B factor RsbW [Paenibacillus sp. SYP-B4298]|uniref:anti-sigma B factor RsbW n=1 Tax=Paenibacillus sp. SYP-B4298 TaxID=2996034 RepID=UPI0022DDDE1E|nr:anti-sigma B factor RsbW [Paenibacillus sp. SYP-B4298]
MKAIEEVVQLHVPATAEYVDLVRVTLYGIAAKMGFSYEDIEDMKVAVSEACNNAVLHAYNHEAATSSEERRMHIEFVKSPHALSIVVQDNGHNAIALAEAPRTSPLLGKSIEDINSGGLGLYLMQALMDQVEVLSEAGTRVTLTKRLVRSEELA